MALDAKTGERKWHFQIVHHDLWDRDLPAAPNLFEMERDGKKIPAVAQVTKSGHVFVFNRLTGEPLYPIEEVPFPASNLDYEQASPTQPIPVKPVPFARQKLSQQDLYEPERPSYIRDFVDRAQNENPLTVGDKFAGLKSTGNYTPVDTVGTVIFPGTDGGAEWGGAALDPKSNVLFVTSNELPWIVRMRRSNANDYQKQHPGKSLAQLHCARCHGGKLQGSGGIPNLMTAKEHLGYDS